MVSRSDAIDVPREAPRRAAREASVEEEVEDDQYDDRHAQQPTDEILAHDDVSWKGAATNRLKPVGVAFRG